MDKMKMHTPNMADENFQKLAALFPNAVTETITGYEVDGKPIIERAIDADVLRQEISVYVVEGRDERYQFTWPDKKKTMLAANSPIAATLRPLHGESVGRDGTPGGWDSENLYIEGDNLDVLKLLQETYLGKIKMIYIDPPYNTGSDTFVYDDDRAMSEGEFSIADRERDSSGNILFDMRVNNEGNGRFHTDWLNMLYPRLRLAKTLLSEDGFIAVSIGEEECDNLRKILDEVFGQQNFRNIIEVRRYDKNLNLQFASEGLSTMNVGLEYIYVYSKTPTSKMVAVYRPSTDDRANLGYWKGFWNNADRPTMRYDVLGVTPTDGQWKWKREVALEAVENYREYEQRYATRMTIEEYWTMTGKTKRFIRRKEGGTGKNLGVEHWVAPADGILRNSNWSDMLVSRPAGFDIPFESPKNPDVIMELIKLFGLSDGDICLDFFSGSATTAQAIFQLNATDGEARRFILVQLPEQVDPKSDAAKQGFSLITEIGKERIRRAGHKIKEDAGLMSQKLDIGFRVLRLDSSNMEDVYYNPADLSQDLLSSLTDNIKSDRSPEDLLFQVMLDLGIDLSSAIIETVIDGRKVYDVADGFLLACFDCDVTTETVTAIAQKKPYYAVLRDSGMANDSVATNFDQVFEAYSPSTVRKVL